MAANENQGLHIALIVLFMLFIVLSLTTFVYFGQSNRYFDQAKAAVEASKKSDTTRDKFLNEVSELKSLIGVANEDEVEKIKTQHAEDMKAYAATLPAEKQHYRQSLEELSKTIIEVQAKNVAQAAELTIVKAKNATTEADAAVKVKSADEARDKAVAELDVEKKKFMEAQKLAESQKKDVSEQLTKVQTENAAELEKLTKVIEQDKKDITKAQRTIDELTGTLNRLRGGSFDVDDGEIRSVTPRNQTVVLNLGANDGLRRQITFFVHGPNASPTDAAARKGTIEVTEILGEHLAEARIVEDSAKNPMLPGDKIYTALWDPGRRERFAILGRIDIDGEGRDNRDRLKSMITLSGGIIDAEVDNEGKVTGKISVDTRYVIEGDVSPKAKPAIDKLLADSKLLGVERIGVDKFLDYIGWKANSQVTRYGVNSNIEEVRGRPQDGGPPKGGAYYTDLFRKRTPPPNLKLDNTTAPRGGAPTSIKY